MSRIFWLLGFLKGRRFPLSPGRFLTPLVLIQAQDCLDFVCNTFAIIFIATLDDLCPANRSPAAAAEAGGSFPPGG